MSSTRRYPTKHVNNGQSSTPRTSTHLNVKDWLKMAKLSDYYPIFTREKISIEELLTFTDSELNSIANETLHLTVLHRKRFISAMNETKRIFNINNTNNTNNSHKITNKMNKNTIYSRSSSHLSRIATPIERPLSPTLSLNGINIDTPLDHEYKYKPPKHPAIASNYNNHNSLYKNKYRLPASTHMLPSIPSKYVPKCPKINSNGNGNDNIFASLSPKAKSRNPLLNKHKKHSRSRSSSDTSQFLHIALASSSNNMAAADTDSISSETSVNNQSRHSKQRQFSITRLANNSTACTHTITSNINPTLYTQTRNGYNLIDIMSQHAGDNEENMDLQRLSLNSSGDASSNNEMHSEDEKWDALELKNNMSQHNKSINVLLEENKADSNQIDHGMKVLNINYNQCKQDMKKYFDVLHRKLNERHTELLQILLNVKNHKSEGLEQKVIKLQENKQHILKKSSGAITDISQLMDVYDDDVIDFNEFEAISQIEIDYDIHERDFFCDNICVIKECTLPHSPKIKVKHVNNTSVTLKIVIMTTKEKKAIQHYPFTNHTKNNRIAQVEIEYIQTHCNNINKVFKQTEHKSVAETAMKPVPSKRKTKRKPKTKKNKRKTRKSAKKEDINEENKENENDIRGIERIVIEENKKIKRIHEITINLKECSHKWIFIRARTQNINGWSTYCQVISVQLPEMLNDLKFDVTNSSNCGGVEYLMEDKCIVFSQMNGHNIGVLNVVIDKHKYDTFEWKYSLQFDGEPDEDNDDDDDYYNDNYDDEGICMGFIGYPLLECMDFTDVQLGRTGTQYGLFVANNSIDSHAYFTRDGSIHHTCSIKLKKKVVSGDEFTILCYMKQGKCDIYHNDDLLINVFNSKIPDTIIPAVSGYMNDGNVSCTVDFVSST